jgi:hypothetical protein
VASDSGHEYLTIDQACAVYGVRMAEMRRVLREYGLGDFVRNSMKKDVLLRRDDLERILRGRANTRRPGAA